MQRINLFPDPNMANTIFQCIPSRCTVDFPTVSGFRWLRATTSGSGDIYAQYQLAGVNLPKAGVYHIHAVCYAQGSGAFFRVYAGVGNRFTILHETGIADNQTKIIDADITIPANTTHLLIRVVPPSKVGKFILIRDILLESKSIYDTGVAGGASGLLHGRHDAARIGASVGRVVPDDACEPVYDAAFGLRFEAGRQHAYGVCGHGRRGLLFPRLGDLRWGHGEADDRRYDANLQRQRESHREIHAEIIESDCQHGGRVRRSESEARGLLRLRKLCAHDRRIPKVRDHGPLQREYDAARLALLGVMA